MDVQGMDAQGMDVWCWDVGGRGAGELFCGVVDEWFVWATRF